MIDIYTLCFGLLSISLKSLLEEHADFVKHVFSIFQENRILGVYDKS